jgi:hypothetical protein
VGSYSLQQFTDKHGPFLPDSAVLNINEYTHIQENQTLHVCPQSLPYFVNNVLPTISVKFKLVTNNSDATLPDDYENECKVILSCQFLIHWFSQNWIGDHLKITRIPIGLDYHTLVPPAPKFAWSKKANRYHAWGLMKKSIDQERDLLDIKIASSPFWQRELKCYSNYFSMRNTRYGSTERVEANSVITKEICYTEDRYIDRIECWKHMSTCVFVVSPFGNGLDCHRTWEALCLGCIPIVKSSGIDSLFKDLPVWIVKNWKEVTLENMKQKVEEFKDKSFNYQKLTLAYWKSKIINT